MARTASIVALTLLLLAGTAQADLKVGDKAPPIKVSRWLKGDPIKFAEEKGKKIYVLEFWATWCGPCVAGIPHMTEVAEYFKSKGVEVIAVSIDGAGTLSRVEPFVKGMGKKMNYHVALDDHGATARAYMAAAGVSGIPHAFIIDREGKLAWHGHPRMGIEGVLAKMLNDWGLHLGKVETKLAAKPDDVQAQYEKYRLLAAEKKDARAANRWGQAMMNGTENTDFLNQIAWIILTDKVFKDVRDTDLAIAFARKANDLTAGKDWSVLDTYALALFKNGQIKEALERELKSLEIATQNGEKKENLVRLKRSVKRYQQALEPAGEG